MIESLPPRRKDMDPYRDIFLSHGSVDKDFVRRLASDIEAASVAGRRLRVWA